MTFPTTFPGSRDDNILKFIKKVEPRKKMLTIFAYGNYSFFPI